MNKGLRRADARECPVHMALMNEAIERLGNSGVFSITEVLDAKKYAAMAEAIRWDYIREFIQEDHDMPDLVPLSQAFFDRHKKGEEYVNPGKFIATGNRKKMAGFAAVTPDHAHLVVARLKQRRSQINGAWRQFESSAGNARDRIGRDDQSDPPPQIPSAA